MTSSRRDAEGKTRSPRATRFLAEARDVVGRVPRDDLKAWATRSVLRFPKGVGRRVVGLATLARSLGKGVVDETVGASQSLVSGTTREHVLDRARASFEAADRLSKDVAESLFGGASLVRELRTNPSGAALRVLGLTAGFLVGSGGVDADGGIPDLDLLLGIGAHRSVLTHSFIAGTLAEGVLFSALDLMTVVESELPAERDELWDTLLGAGREFALGLQKGTSAGLAYHLGADATFDGMTPLKDLPVSLPIEGHQAILGASAVAEATAVADPKEKSHRWVVVKKKTEGQ